MVILEARGLVKHFGRRVVFDGASLQIHAGEMVGISAGNGAGKSTLLKMLAGFLTQDYGTMWCRVPIGYCPQVILLYDQLTIEEHFQYFGAARAMARPWREVGLELARRYGFEPWWGERIGTLSEGTKQKLNLALALAHDPGLLLLDEPYSGFDWETYLLFWEHAAALKASGKTLLIVSHLFYDRRQFDRILRIANGRIAEEAPG